MSQSTLRRARGILTALVALAMAGLFAVTVRATWSEASHRHAAAGTERDGIAAAVPQLRLLDALAAARMQVAAGTKVDTAAVTAAETAAGAAYRPALGVATRWLDQRTRVTTLVARPGGGGPGAVQDWADAVGLAADLLGAVSDTTTLSADPDVATHGLVAAAARDLPAVVVAAGQAADLAILAAGQPLPGARRTEMSVYRRLVGDAAARVDDVPPATTDAGGGGGELTAAQDAFQAALGRFAAPPDPNDPAGPGYPSNLPALARALQTASLELAEALLARADGRIAARQGAAHGDEERAIGTAVVMLAGALALIWLLSPSRRRVVDDGEPGDSATAEPERPGPVDAGTLIDARDLLLEELVHIGRGVRPPVRSSDDDAQ